MARDLYVIIKMWSSIHKVSLVYKVKEPRTHLSHEYVREKSGKKSTTCAKNVNDNLVTCGIPKNFFFYVIVHKLSIMLLLT